MNRTRSRVVEVVERYGRCLELVSRDPHFHEITVGLYEKGGTLTVWSFSDKPGVTDRLGEIRDLLVQIGGLSAVTGTHDQMTFPCGQVHTAPLRILMAEAVEKPAERELPSGPIEAADLRSELRLRVTPRQDAGRWVYAVSADGEAEGPERRIRATVVGFVRHGGMEETGPDEVGFPCGARHDELVRLLLPHARSVSSASEAVPGQMTAKSLGF